MPGACPRSLALLPLCLAVEGEPQSSQDSEKDAHPLLPQLEGVFLVWFGFLPLLAFWEQKSRLGKVELSFPFTLMV